MRRRRFLSALGVALPAVLGGCLGAPRASTRQPTDEPNGPSSPTSSSPRTDGIPAGGTTPIPPDSEVSFDEEAFEMKPSPESPFEEASLGERTGVPNPESNRPHGVTVWNGVDREREIRVRVVGRDAGELLDAAWTFPAWGYAELTLNWPDTYRIVCAVRGGDGERATVPQSTFDCNSSRTTVGVFEGDLKQMTVSTAMAYVDEATPS